MSPEILKKIYDLATRAKSICRPNPAVGAVVLRNGKIVAEGHTQVAGKEHAEVMALGLGKNWSGAELVVSLMPCCFQGRTPACTDLIVKANLKRVTVILNDPNPKVAESKKLLEKFGVEVRYLTPSLLIEEQEAWEWVWKLFLLNLDYYQKIILGEPSLTIKYAMSLDGKLANGEGRSKWISGELSRAQVHLERSHHDAIMIGAKTFIRDDPRLTVRQVDCFKPPLPVVVITRNLEFDRIKNHHLITSPAPALFILPASLKGLKKKIESQHKSVAVFNSQDATKTDWASKKFITLLAREWGWNSIYVEGGAGIQARLLATGLVNQFSVFVAPVLFLGDAGTHPFEKSSPNKTQDGYFPPLALFRSSSQKLGNDIWIKGIYEENRVKEIWKKVLPFYP